MKVGRPYTLAMALLLAPVGCKKEDVPVAAKPTAETSAPLPTGKTYGAGVSDVASVSIDEIAKDPHAYNGKTVRVEGMVTDVCPMRGCWFSMAGKEPGNSMRFKVPDGQMVFPMSAKGQHAVAQGKVVTETLSLEQTRKLEEHLAFEMGKEFDPESITEGRTVFRLQGTGAVIGVK